MIWKTGGAEETRVLGMQLGACLAPGTVVGLFGGLGAGKTCLAQGICRGLGVKEYVTSPTFVLIHEYQGRIPVYHFDLYRLCDAEDLFELGYEEYFYGDGVCRVEWAERAGPLWPEGSVDVALKPLGADIREISLSDPAGKLVQMPPS
ncbi:MAG: tRNA (adenosine(37)-N6)-threonylcarbamoyltransferase complex ATPase subunit type 1 TsaE [Candidatus Latescibacterota bacterium]